MFRLYRYGSTSPSPPLISIDYSSSPRTVTSMTSLSFLAIALIPTWPYFCVAYPSRLAIEYCRQRDLCTLVIILSIAYIPYHSGAYRGILSCVTKLSSHTQLLSWFGKFCMRKEIKSERVKQAFKQKGNISKELISKNHSIIQH